VEPGEGVSALAPTAAAMGLLSCPACNMVSRPPKAAHTPHCPRCGSKIFFRKPHSISRTWAYLIAAYVLYIPANVLPVMESTQLFELQQNDTILSGVIFLWNSGSYFTAALILFASVVEPMLKLFVLTYLVLSVQRGWHAAPRQRTHMYRLVKVVGRWSMLDIFVATILTALVQVQTVAQIEIGRGAFAFGAVVVLTMLATLSFDPRLMWDPPRRRHE
jgi:paraquat-inducible protein A